MKLNTGTLGQTRPFRRLTIFASALGFVVVGAYAADTAPTAGGMSRAAVHQQVLALTALGRELFFEPGLSSSGKMACSTCHDPAHAFGPVNALPVQLGGADLKQPGLRAVPSLKYLQVVPSFTQHFFDSEDDSDESIDNGPTGGLMWDGRVDRSSKQAAFPLTSPFEMDNAGKGAVAERLAKAGYDAKLAAIAGKPVADDPDLAFDTAVKALEVFQQDYKLFYPYSSKFDAYLAGKAKLTAQEARGFDLFDREDKGNCASCHISRRGNDGTPPQFTDFGQLALGLPRNMAIPANQDPNYYDLGVCGPLRTDYRDRKDYCGLFRTPTLRNVALRKTFFHNGIFHTLREAVAFYVERETDPGKYYPRRPDGSIDKYNDLPDYAKANVNMDPPFDRHVGQAPALSPSEIDDVVAFLGTLTDGYEAPASP